MHYIRVLGRGHLGLTRFANVPRGNVLFYVLRERRENRTENGSNLFQSL